MTTDKNEMDRNLEIVVEEIEKELRGFNLKEPVIDLRSGVPLWEETILDKALRNANFGDSVDEVAEAVEELRRENQECLLSMTLQALHDDLVSFVAWTLPSGVTAYLVESWNGETELFAIDFKERSTMAPAEFISAYVNAVFMGKEPDGSKTLRVSPIAVQVNLRSRTKEIEFLESSAT